MRPLIVIAGISLFVLTLMYGCVSYTEWRYNECKTVGHSTTYCVVNIGS